MPEKNGRVNRKLLLAIYHGRNYVREGKYVDNHIGETTYISFDDLKPEEIIAIGEFKRVIAR